MLNKGIEQKGIIRLTSVQTAANTTIADFEESLNAFMITANIIRDEEG